MREKDSFESPNFPHRQHRSAYILLTGDQNFQDQKGCQAIKQNLHSMSPEKNKKNLDKISSNKSNIHFRLPPFFILVHKASWLVPAKVVISPNVLNVFVALDQNSFFPFHQRMYSLNSAFRCSKFHLNFPVQCGSKEPPILIALLTIYLPQCCVTSTLCIF